MKSVGLYVHIPFCHTKCPYCDFYSVVTSNSSSQQLQRHYVDVLCQSILRYQHEGLRADTLYIGGGTPNLLSPLLIQNIIHTCHLAFGLFQHQTPEITIEVNPEFVQQESLLQLYHAGVNRLSFGMQSTQPKELLRLGRSHTSHQLQQGITLARQIGFRNISLDVMVGIPDQTSESLSHTLQQLLSFQPNHVSAYLLKIEPHTPFAQYQNQNTHLFPDDEFVSDRYLQVCHTLSNAGLLQYEISNFSQPDKRSMHNLKYWKRQPYLGFGPSAHSFFNEKRFYVPPSLVQFFQTKGAHFSVDSLPNDPLEELILLGLRLREGLSFSQLSNQFGVCSANLRIQLQPYCQAGWMVCSENHFALTPEGFLLSNSLILKLIPLIQQLQNTQGQTPE